MKNNGDTLYFYLAIDNFHIWFLDESMICGINQSMKQFDRVENLFKRKTAQFSDPWEENHKRV